MVTSRGSVYHFMCKLTYLASERMVNKALLLAIGLAKITIFRRELFVNCNLIPQYVRINNSISRSILV